MKKFAWLTALIAVLAFLFVGCTDEPTPPKKKNPGTEIKNPRVVTFDLNGHGTHASAKGGATSWTVTVESGKTVAKPADPTDPDFDFGGWFLNPDDPNATAFNFTTPISTATILKAKWTTNKPTWTVTFKADGATVATQLVLQSSGKVTEPTQKTVGSGANIKDIIGWYKDEGLKTPFVFATDTVTGDTNIYAKLRARMANFEWKSDQTYDAKQENNQSADPYAYWDLTDATLNAMIAAYKADPPASKLRLHFYTKAENFSGWGFGKFGHAIPAPGTDITFGDWKARSGGNHYIDVWIGWFIDAYAEILFTDGDTAKAVVSPLPKIAVRTWIKDDDPAGGPDYNTELTNIELWTSTNNRTTPPPIPDVIPVAIPDANRKENRKMEGYLYVQDVDTTSAGDVDINIGKGEITGDDLQAIKDVGATGRLRFYVRNLTSPYESRAGWGIGVFGGNNVNGPAETTLLTDTVQSPGRQIEDDELSTEPTRERDFIIELGLDKIANLANLTAIFCNIWTNMAIVHCELWEVDPEAGADRPATVNLVADLVSGEGHPYWSNYRGEIQNDWLFKGGQVTVGDRYELTYTFKADKAISKLAIFLVDMTKDAGGVENSYWKELSAQTQLLNIGAGTEYSATIPMVAIFSATSAAEAANTLMFHADITGGPFKLEFSNIKIAKAPVGGNLGDFGLDPNAPAQRGWSNADVSYAAIKAADYVVLEVILPSRTGTSPLTMWYQGGGKPGGGNFDWTEPNIGKATTLSTEAYEAVYIVVDLHEVTGWDTFAENVSGWAQFGFGGLTGMKLLAAWITTVDLSTKPGTAVDMENTSDVTTGYFVKEADWTFNLD